MVNVPRRQGSKCHNDNVWGMQEDRELHTDTPPWTALEDSVTTLKTHAPICDWVYSLICVMFV